MFSTKKEHSTDTNFLNAICNEMAQPLTTMTSLIELWERGLAEPDDLEMMKQELNRINTALKELRAFSNGVKAGPAPTISFNLDSLEAALPVLNHTSNSSYNHPVM
jgi:hypothetical protein